MPVLKSLLRTRPLDKNDASVATISFSLTFVGVTVALMAGMLPRSLSVLASRVDVAVVLLLVPLCALTLAILFEVLVAAVRGLPRVRPPAAAAALTGWRPGAREG